MNYKRKRHLELVIRDLKILLANKSYFDRLLVKLEYAEKELERVMQGL